MDRLRHGLTALSIANMEASGKMGRGDFLEMMMMYCWKGLHTTISMDPGTTPCLGAMENLPERKGQAGGPPL